MAPSDQELEILEDCVFQEGMQAMARRALYDHGFAAGRASLQFDLDHVTQQRDDAEEQLRSAVEACNAQADRITELEPARDAALAERNEARQLLGTARQETLALELIALESQLAKTAADLDGTLTELCVHAEWQGQGEPVNEAARLLLRLVPHMDPNGDAAKHLARFRAPPRAEGTKGDG